MAVQFACAGCWLFLPLGFRGGRLPPGGVVVCCCRLCHSMRLGERCSAMELALCLMGLVLFHPAQTRGGEWQGSLAFLQF